MLAVHLALIQVKKKKQYKPNDHKNDHKNFIIKL